MAQVGGPINDSIAWWEAYPRPPVFNSGMHVYSGQIASVAVSGSASAQSFQVANWSTGQVWSVQSSSLGAYWDGTSAEVVDELVAGNGPGGSAWELRRTTNPTGWQNMSFNSGSTFGSAASLVDTVTMVRSSHNLEIGGFSAPTNTAADYWQNCL